MVETPVETHIFSNRLNVANISRRSIRKKSRPSWYQPKEIAFTALIGLPIWYVGWQILAYIQAEITTFVIQLLH